MKGKKIDSYSFSLLLSTGSAGYWGIGVLDIGYLDDEASVVVKRKMAQAKISVGNRGSAGVLEER